MIENTLPPITPEQQETHDALMELYDLAEELVDTVDHPDVQNPEAQLLLVEPLIETIEETAEILNEEYSYYVQSGKTPGLLNKKRMENAMRTLFLAIKKGKEHLTLLQEKEEEKKLGKLFKGVSTVLESLSEHLEKVFSLLQSSLNIDLKSYRLSRGGRQDGASLGKGTGVE